MTLAAILLIWALAIAMGTLIVRRMDKALEHGRMVRGVEFLMVPVIMAALAVEASVSVIHHLLIWSLLLYGVVIAVLVTYWKLL